LAIKERFIKTFKKNTMIKPRTKIGKFIRQRFDKIAANQPYAGEVLLDKGMQDAIIQAVEYNEARWQQAINKLIHKEK